MAEGRKACPECGAHTVKVLDSRPPASNHWPIYRRYVCEAPGCRAKWTTYELLAAEYDGLLAAESALSTVQKILRG